jgi:hypothetical protein
VVRSLILVHRYLGIPLSFLFVIWFVSGIGMIYVGGMPTLTPQARLEQLPALDLAAVRLTPSAAAARAESGGFGRVTLASVLDRPAYRFGGAFGSTTVFADTGEVLEEVDVATTRTIAARFLNAAHADVEFERIVEAPDQWTLLLRRDLPLHKFAVHDGAGTQAYVSPFTAEVRLVTTTRTRTLAWIATIPHWFYITPLRNNQPLWYWTVVSTSALGCVLAVLGLLLGIVRFRKSKPFRLAASIRYTGWMRWHYILGVLFGLFALTWVFSGLLSMEPFAWTNAPGLQVRDEELSGGPLELERFPAVDAARWRTLLGNRTLKEVEFRRIQGEPYYLARYTAAAAQRDPQRERLHQPYPIVGRAAPQHVLVDAGSLKIRSEPFGIDTLVARLRAGAPNTPIIAQDLLPEYDAYYYSRARQAPLPVLRVKFDDPLQTWVYVNPELGEIVGSVHRRNRLERWLYNGLHSLDFSFWYYNRPLWDFGMIGLCLGALVTSFIGLWLGLKRVRQDAARLRRSR